MGGNPAANLDQCANGPLATPVACNSAAAWVNGNLNENQAHYLEGEAVPYRLRFSNLALATHTVRIEWDTTVLQAGAPHHALDYVTTFDASEALVDPCAGVTGCSSFTRTTANVPLDPWVTAGPDGVASTADDLAQEPGLFTLFGGTITGVSAYTHVGTLAGSSSTSITLTFTAHVDTPVLSWGGHIAKRIDWRPQLTGTHIPGSPYHTRLLDLDGAGGNQDRSLSAAAVYAMPELIVIKQVVNDNGGTAVSSDFTMTVTATNPSPASFPGAGAPGTSVALEPGTYSVGETGPAGYAATYSEACTGTLAYDQVATCTVVNDDNNLCLTVTCAPPASECLEAGVCDPATGVCAYAPKAAGTACADDGNLCTLDQCDAAGECAHPAGHAGELCRGAEGACDVPEYCDGALAACPADAKAVALCRASTGVCDAAETCDGVGNDCPADGYAALGTVCRGAVGICDTPEVCTGGSPLCPGDGFKTSAFTCRDSAGFCDTPEVCAGDSADCPGDVLLGGEVTCREAAGVCDLAETCSGLDADCPSDLFKKMSFTCRDAVGVCDTAEACTGVSADCPANTFLGGDVTCREAVGVCDTPEVCAGGSAECPEDAFLGGEVTCRDAVGVCDTPEVCTGSTAECPANGFLTDDVTCRPAAGRCDEEELCTGAAAECPADVFRPMTVTCRESGGVCDPEEYCTGTGPTCPADVLEPTTVVCRRSFGFCDVTEYCTGFDDDCPGDVLKDPTVVCREPADVCDATEYCTGTMARCPMDAVLPATELCRAEAGTCDTAEYCTGTGMACPADTKRTTECRGLAGVCDQAESCDGVGDDCPADTKLTTQCRGLAGVCDQAESCDGVSDDCPADTKLTTECRAAAGECDVSERCNGVDDACPTDGFVAAGAVCRAAIGECNPAELCSGTAGACPADVTGDCTLCGEKYYDANANGEFEAEERTIAGWQMTLEQGAALVSADTDTGGRYTFAGLAEGDYRVCERVAVETNWLQTEPATVCYAVHVPSAEGEACRLDFGNVCLGAGGGHNIGFWSNKNGSAAFQGLDKGATALALLRGLPLVRETGAAFDPISYPDFKRWLNDSRAMNMAYMLSAQLAAMELNLLIGSVDPDAIIYAPGVQSADAAGFATVGALVTEVITELTLHPNAPADTGYRAYQTALERALNGANKNEAFRSDIACAFSFRPL